MGTETQEALYKIISEATLLADMENVTFDVNTTFWKLRSPRKSIFYRMEKMIAATEISALDHNNNILREHCFRILKLFQNTGF